MFLNATALPNATAPPSSSSPSNSTSYTVPVNVCIGILVLAINCFVLTLFVRRPSLRFSPSNRILLSLAIRDLVNGLLIFVNIIITHVDVLLTAGTSSALIFRIFFDIISTGNQVTAVFHLCFIAYDRYISIAYALRYDEIMTSVRVKTMLVIIWACAYAVPLPQLAWLYRIMDGEQTDDDWAAIGEIEPWYSVAVLVVFAVIPLLITLVMYVAMFAEVKRIVNYNAQDSNRKARQKQQNRVFLIFISMHLSFVLLTLPYFATRLVMDFHAIRHMRHAIEPIYLNLGYFTFNIASISTPLLYTLYKQDFRQAVAAILGKAKRYLPCKTGRERSQSNDDYLPSNTTEMSVSHVRHYSTVEPDTNTPPAKNHTVTFDSVGNDIELKSIKHNDY